jgi:hypothetical protein
MTEVVSTSETSVNFYQTTRSYNPDDSHLHSRRRENLKSYLQFVVRNTIMKLLLFEIALNTHQFITARLHHLYELQILHQF